MYFKPATYQGMFWDTLMYAGTYQEYHDGVPKTFVDFFYTDRFQDAYIIFFCIFGPPFYALVSQLLHFYFNLLGLKSSFYPAKSKQTSIKV